MVLLALAQIFSCDIKEIPATKTHGQVISAGELFFKAQYLWSMQENTNWYL